MRRALLLTGLVWLLIAGSCDDDSGFVEPTTTPVPEDVGYAADSLTATLDIQGFGYRMDHPGDWQFAMFDTQARIAEDPIDLQPDQPLHGITLHIDHNDADALAAAGFDASTGLEGFLEFNAQFHPWPQPLQAEELTVGDAPALRLRASHPNPEVGIEFVHVMGELGDRYYLMTLAIPAGRDADAFMAAFDAMLGSVRQSSS